MKAPTAYDFARVTPRSGKRPGFGFGLDATRAAEALRVLAAAIESGGVMLRKVTAASTTAPQDFAATALTVEYMEPVVEAAARQLVMCPGGCATERFAGAVCPECRVTVPGASPKPAG